MMIQELFDLSGKVTLITGGTHGIGMAIGKVLGQGESPVALRIEDYAIIGDMRSAALVGNNGSIDWLCAPRFDSPAFFAALLGTESNGHWQIAPAGEIRRVERRYRWGSLVLETEFETDDGRVRLVDCMPIETGDVQVVRIVEGLHGRVEMRMSLIPRFDYGRLVPSLGRIDRGIVALAGPDAICLRTSVDLDEIGGATFTVSEGERVPFHLADIRSDVDRLSGGAAGAGYVF